MHFFSLTLRGRGEPFDCVPFFLFFWGGDCLLACSSYSAMLRCGSKMIRLVLVVGKLNEFRVLEQSKMIA